MLYFTNTGFVVLFTLECLFKLTGLGFTFYFKQPSNQFDFFIVVVSLLGLQEGLVAVNFTAFRIVRVARLLRMLNATAEMQMLLKTLYLALNNIANVCLLFSLLVFVFTVAGMDLFGDVVNGSQGFLNEDANFTSFYSGVMVLIRTSTGESWNGLMHDCSKIDSFLSPIFWMSYTFIGFFVYINVLIAVIFEEYGNASL